MDPVTRPDSPLINPEAVHSVPASFVSLPSAADISIKHITSPKVTFGIVSDLHSLMSNPKIETWAQGLCSTHLLIALTAWFEGDLEEIERVQSEGYKDISVTAKELLESIIKSEKDLKPE